MPLRPRRRHGPWHGHDPRADPEEGSAVPGARQERDLRGREAGQDHHDPAAQGGRVEEGQEGQGKGPLLGRLEHYPAHLEAPLSELLAAGPLCAVLRPARTLTATGFGDGLSIGSRRCLARLCRAPVAPSVPGTGSGLPAPSGNPGGFRTEFRSLGGPGQTANPLANRLTRPRRCGRPNFFAGPPTQPTGPPPRAGFR